MVKSLTELDVFNHSVHTRSVIPCSTPSSKTCKIPVNKHCLFLSCLFFTRFVLNGGEIISSGLKKEVIWKSNIPHTKIRILIINCG
jgi:hypothetical protein